MTKVAQGRSPEESDPEPSLVTPFRPLDPAGPGARSLALGQRRVPANHRLVHGVVRWTFLPP